MRIHPQNMKALLLATLIAPSLFMGTTRAIAATAAPSTAGSTANCPAWAEGNTYTVGNCVTFNARTYTAVIGHTAAVGAGWNPEAATDLWQVQNIDSAKPAQDCMDWQDGYQYNVGQKTKYQDKSWIALTAHTAYLTAGWVPGQAPSLWRVASEAEACPIFIPLPAHQPVVSRFYRYDNADRVVQSMDIKGYQTQFAYNENGRLQQKTDPFGRKTGYQYDALQRISEITDPAAGVVKLGYDGRDKLTSVTDPEGFATRYDFNARGDLTKLTSPDTGVTQYTVDVAGQTGSKQDARNKTAQIQYDPLGRVISVDYGSGLLHSYSYDTAPNGYGQIAGFGDPHGTTAYAYDNSGQPIKMTRTSGQLVQSVSYQWQGGHINRVVYPSGLTVDYNWQNGATTAVQINGKPLLDQALWTAAGQAIQWRWSNGQVWFQPRDGMGQVAGNYLAKSGQLYSYDAVGNPIQIKDVQRTSRKQDYGYDSLDRLVQGNVNGTSYTYAYDRNSGRVEDSVGAAVTQYTHDKTNNRLLNTSGAQTQTYNYDASGNRLQDAGLVHTYDASGRLIQTQRGTQVIQYRYNALGQRIAKQVGTIVTRYVYDEAGRLLGEYDDAGRAIQETVWLGDTPVATVRAGADAQNPSVYYVWADHLGAPREVSDANTKQIVWRWEGEAFGNNVADEDPERTGKTFAYNLRFPGQLYDKETGRHYNYFRDYDPQTGRYIESDPIGLLGGINTYSYADSSPIFYIDQYGLRGGAGTGARIPNRIQEHNRWNDPHSQLRSQNKEVLGDPNAPLPIIPQEKKWDCIMECPSWNDDGLQCKRGNLTNGTPYKNLATGEMCTLSCTDSPVMTAVKGPSNPTPSSSNGSGQKNATSGDWKRLRDIIKR